MNINLHNALGKRATYRVRARTSCRRPTKYQWYLMEGLLDRCVSKRIQLDEAQVRAGGSWKWWWPELAPLEVESATANQSFARQTVGLGKTKTTH